MKKSHAYRWGPLAPPLAKLLRVMKLTGVFMFVGILTVSAEGFSQDARVSLSLREVKLAKFFKAIEKETNYRFAFSNDILPSGQTVTVNVKRAPVSEVLNQVLEPTRLKYRFADESGIIIISEKTGDGATEHAPLILFQQVTGKVTDDKGNGLAGVTVFVKGTSRRTLTRENGSFAIEAKPGETIEFSMVGYNSSSVKMANQTSLAISLVQNTSNLSDVVVVGYAVQKKVTVTGAVASVKGADLEKSPTVNLSNSLVGRLPGVIAINRSGEPGYDGSTIQIRGTNTIGNSSALIVIDGVPDRTGGLERINPADIESVSILKDASAAIYGVRGANGVILITTKRGKSGKPQILYDFNQGWSQPTRIPKMSNAPEYAEINNELLMFSKIPSDQWSAAWPALKQTGKYTRSDNNVTVTAPYQPSDIQKYADGSDPWGHPNTDWFKGALKTWSGQTRHNLQISGGSENFKFLTSLGYQDQDAYYKNSATGYRQYDLRINLDAKVNKYINTTLGIIAREEYRFFPTQSAGSVFRMLMRGKPTEQEIWPNGLPGPDIENGQNPVVITTNQTGYDRDTRDYFQTNGKVEITNPWVDGLKLSLIGSADKYTYRGKRWETPWYLYFWDKVSYQADGKTPLLTKSVRSTFTDPRLTQRDESQLNINLTAMLNYDRKIADKHTIGVMAAVTKETVSDDNFSAFRRYFISSAIDQMFAGGTDQQNADGSGYNRARLSYFGRVSYNYEEKYLLEFVWRNDGSYIFPKEKRFGFFPGVLAGWNISNENFFRRHVPFINYLKLRGSYGQMGSDQVYYNGALQEYAFASLYNLGTQVINNQVLKTLSEIVVPNSQFTWEIGNNANIGLEGTTLNGKLSFELDYFYNKRSNMLIHAGSVPGSSGISGLLPPINAGKMENKGFEFKIGYNGQAGDLKYTIGVNGGYAKNKILYWDETPGIPDYQRSTGHSYGTSGPNFLAYIYDGVFKDAKDIAANTIDYSALTPQLRPGDMKIKNISGTGKINANDRVRLDQNRDPVFSGGVTMGLQYKNFDLSILFQGAAGGLLFIGTESGDIGNYLQYSYDHRWSVDHPSSVDPRLANRGDTYYTGGGASTNTYFLRNSDYIRLKNVELGYNLGPVALKKTGISALRVYVNGLNLATWDKMKIWDPESTSGNGQYYPQSRIINGGVRVTF